MCWLASVVASDPKVKTRVQDAKWRPFFPQLIPVCGQRVSLLRISRKNHGRREPLSTTISGSHFDFDFRCVSVCCKTTSNLIELEETELFFTIV